LSIAEFCRQDGVSAAAFYAWRKRLQKRPASLAVESLSQREPRRGRRRSPQGRAASDDARRPLFVPVAVARAGIVSPGGIQMELPGGAVVTLPAESSAALLATAIRAAMSPGVASAEDASC
jgi:hypothetical protein